jgi:Fe-S cluster assembly protein SufB
MAAAAYRHWPTMREPKWARVDYGPIDYQDLYYYSAPKKSSLRSLDESTGNPQDLREARHSAARAGNPRRRGARRRHRVRAWPVDAVFDSVSVATTFQKS